MEIANKYGWLAVVHVYPTQDERPHTLENCWCNPQPDDDAGEILVHSSADGRENFETKERKPS
jgi:hypothetical protein